MKKGMCLLMACVLLLGLCACGQKPAEPETAEWTRQGYFGDEDGNMLSVTWMDDIDVPGWYVGVMIGDFWGGNTMAQEGKTLRGDMNALDESAEPYIVTVSEEGEDGLLLQIEGGESYHFTPMELPEAKIFVTVNTEGLGNIAYTEGENTPEVDPERPYQSAVINLAEPAAHTFLAWPHAGYVFVKWTKNGEDFSTEPQITLPLDESVDLVAVFEEDPDWQNPVMNFVGDYQSGRAHAKVECMGYDEAWITIEWGSSASELTRWLLSGKLDTETLTIRYEGANKANLVYDENGEVQSEENVYEDGTGTIAFHEDGGFTWHEDQAEGRDDMVFEWLPVMTANEIGLANPWREVTEAEAKELCIKSFAAPEGAENVTWSVLDAAADASGIPGALVQLSFDLDGNHFTAREQMTGEEAVDASGMYFTWTVEREAAMKNWADGSMTAHLYRAVGESEYADLCTWYDVEAGVSYSLGVTAEDLDGFDILAVADAMAD